MKMKVLVTCPPMLKQIQEFRHLFISRNIDLITPNVIQTLSEEELIAIVPEVDGWIIGDDPATRKVFEAGRSGNLKAAVKWGVGIDNVDFKACKDLNIPISNTPKMFGDEVADLAIAYFLALARQTHYIDREVRLGNWIKPAGISLKGKTVAVVGLGDIGQATVRRLKGFEVLINAYDPFTEHSANDLGISEIMPFPEKISDADFLILTCALTESNMNMINSNTLGLMKDGVSIINVSRGALINELDLIESLKSGKVRSVALDVYESEPLDLNNGLREFDQCIFGSHNGSNTYDAVTRASLRSIDLLFSFLHIH